MPKILPRSNRIKKKLKKHNLQKKFKKQLRFLENNPSHPGLNVELLAPKKHGIYSFRIDRKFRALFVFRDDNNAIEVLTITKHYE